MEDDYNVIQADWQAENTLNFIAGWDEPLDDYYYEEDYEEDYEEEEDDDPRCVCGVYLSEHALLGCDKGFTTPKEWEAEKRLIQRLARLEEDGMIGSDWQWWE
jgi:hypothetical protein